MTMPTQISAVDAGFGTKAAAPLPLEQSVVSMENGGIFAAGQSEWGMIDQRRTNGFHSEYEFSNSAGADGGIYDGIALPHYFLEQYYSQVRTQLNIFYFLYCMWALLCCAPYIKYVNSNKNKVQKRIKLDKSDNNRLDILLHLSNSVTSDLVVVLQNCVINYLVEIF